MTSSARSSTTWGYAYDPIGNRVSSPQTGEPGKTYVSNTLDKYTVLAVGTSAAAVRLMYHWMQRP